jgi:hypothetical protein
MSYPILNIPFSLKNGVKKTPHFTSIVQKTAAMMGNASVSVSPYPTWDYDVDLTGLTGSESIANSALAGFVGTYIQCNGQANLFLLIDQTDNAVTAMPFAIANGTSYAYQLTRSIGGVGIDVIQNVNGTPTIYINGVPTSNFSLGNTGIITFAAYGSPAGPPPNNAVLSWTGSFYYLCRFADDTLAGLTHVAFNTAGTEIWDCDSIKFSTEFVAPASAGAVVSGVVYENVDGGNF